ncbi:HAMP domain-containing protein [Roseateles sp. DAIF2]|nr:methyl-accepting chemotaxis protein [Roseateles sp. DAIF2]QPF73060.1 HAMP domain-containing protein [Roseateles sp. DAIF2]
MSRSESPSSPSPYQQGVSAGWLERLSLRQRLGLVALLCLALSLLPTGQLARRMLTELDQLATERAGLPMNEAWQLSLRALGAHRLAAAKPPQPEHEAQRRQAAAALAQSLAALQDALAPAGEARRGELRALAEQATALDGALQRRELDAAASLERHRRLSRQMFDALDRLNADNGLLLEPEAAAHFSIIAGLQLAPQIGDALSELSAIAAAAAVDDVASVAAAAARYNEASHRLQLNLAQARERDPQRAADYEQAGEAAARQQAMVNETLAASARDPAYPLERMSESFAQAASLQQALAQQVLRTVDQRLAERARALRHGTGLTLTAVLAGLLAIGWLLWRCIVGTLRPVLQTIALTERIAGGDLSGAVAPTSSRRDEMGRVLQAIDAMQRRLRGLVQQLQEASGRIHRAADEIAAGNQDLNQRSEQSAARMQQAAGNVELLSRTVAQTADAADEASRLAGSAAAAADHGRTVVGQFLGTMNAISDGSQRIAEITGVIDGIAFQTNILALNAAVEAARAGEQGRGFAVVAAEVRALAQRSAAAAREIKGLIGGSVERIEQGSRQIGEAHQAMLGIAQGVGQVDQMIRRIADDAKQESTRMHALSEAIAQIDQMTQQNAALVEQSAAAALSMNRQARQMSDLAGEFRLQAEQ